MGGEIPDFILDTNDNCFFCSSKVSSKVPPKLPLYGGVSLSSLQVLSRYLKINRRKVFLEDGSIPPHLLAKVQRSKLKVELCEECASINESITRMCRQLEKIEMGVASELERIYNKLEQIRNLSKTGEFAALSESRMEDLAVNKGKLQIVEALRKETAQKCSQKIGTLNQTQPQVHVHNLSAKEVNRKMLKFQPQTPLQDPVPDQYGIQKGFSSETILPHSKIKMENNSVVEPAINRWMQNDDYRDEEPFHEFDDYPTADEDLGHSTTDFNLVTKFNVEQPGSDPCPSTAVPAPIKIVPKSKNINNYSGGERNPKTGKYKCGLCPKEYCATSNLHIHFKSAHLKERFKCKLCEKIFQYKQPYEKHYISAHLGVRFNCGKCNKTFTQAAVRDVHVRRNCSLKPTGSPLQRSSPSSRK